MAAPETHGSLGVLSTLHAFAETLRAEGRALPVTRPGAPAQDADRPKLGAGMRGSERYDVLGVLGAGGMGTVEGVWDGDLMRELAVKRLRPELREDARLVAQFLWEARVTAHLDHPNIVPLHDMGLTEDRQIYFTMKRMRGRSLATALDSLRADDDEVKKTLTLQRRLRIFLSMCNAISFAHSRGVLHRDLKPANVMLGEHGEITVMDWGLALPLPTAEGEQLRRMVPDTGGSSSSGTPLYMSPEQARGEPLDARSDVFTLGVMLYELVSLALPYDEPALPALLAKVSSGEARPLRSVCPSASRSIVAVVERAMSRDPNRRYARVADLAADVETILDGRTPKAEDAGFVRRFARFYGSRSGLLASMRIMDWEILITGAILLGVAAGAWGAGWIHPYWGAVLAVGTLCWLISGWRWYRLYRGFTD